MTVTNRSGGSNTYMCLTNYSDTEVLLDPGTVVAVVEPVKLLPQDSHPEASGVHSIKSSATGRMEKLPQELEALAVDAGDGLEPAQADQVHSLLRQHTTAFVGPDGKLGCTELVRHQIDTGEARPVKVPYRPAGFARRQIIEENLQKMLEEQVIEPSVSMVFSSRSGEEKGWVNQVLC